MWRRLLRVLCRAFHIGLRWAGIEPASGFLTVGRLPHAQGCGPVQAGVWLPSPVDYRSALRIQSNYRTAERQSGYGVGRCVAVHMPPHIKKRIVRGITAKLSRARTCSAPGKRREAVCG